MKASQDYISVNPWNMRGQVGQWYFKTRVQRCESSS